MIVLGGKPILVRQEILGRSLRVSSECSGSETDIGSQSNFVSRQKSQM